jgi:DNA repair photolyase
MGKIIYAPKGAAAEYSKYAANFYVGCLGDKGCSYCYCPSVLRGYWPNTPTLKKGLNITDKARHIFMKEADQNLEELRKHGLFFNFVSDPFLPETIELNTFAMRYCILHSIPVIALTKQTWWIADFVQEIINNETVWNLDYHEVQKLIAFGFTLTGHNELEQGCATNEDRISAMKVLSAEGFKTWASIEPIIDFESSYRMIEQTYEFCDLYKVGLRSGTKYSTEDARWFATKVLISCACNHTKVYLKDSLVKLTGWDRENLKEISGSYVDADYNMFADEN